MESLHSGKWRLNCIGLIPVGVWILSTSLFACSAGIKPTLEKQAAEQSIDRAIPVATYTTNFNVSGRPFYHLLFKFNSENLVQVERFSKQEFEQNGGQFEVLLKKTTFPIKAPNCKANLIARMPWVAPGNNLAAKYQLYQTILAVLMKQADSVTVALELNPYVQKTEQGLELTQCNVFFRQANSQYVPHTDSLN